MVNILMQKGTHDWTFVHSSDGDTPECLNEKRHYTWMLLLGGGAMPECFKNKTIIPESYLYFYRPPPRLLSVGQGNVFIGTCHYVDAPPYVCTSGSVHPLEVCTPTDQPVGGRYPTGIHPFF